MEGLEFNASLQGWSRDGGLILITMAMVDTHSTQVGGHLRPLQSYQFLY